MDTDESKETGLAPEPSAAESAAGAAGLSDEQLLEEIERVFDEINLGFDFKVLSVLDDEKARPSSIEALKEQLGELVSARLFSVANSNYFGKLRSGKITRFIDVVMHLGVDSTKSLAIFIALMSLADSDELKSLFARGFATSKLAELLAVQCGLNRGERSTVALGALFIEMGRVFIALYERSSGRRVEADFVERRQSRVGARVIERFELPAVLGTIVDHPYFSFIGKDSLSLPAIVDLAHAIVDRSFARYGKLVVESPMPDPQDLHYARTAGSTLAGQFQAIGLGSYCQIIAAAPPAEQRRQPPEAG